MDRKPEALSAAFFEARSKLTQIKRHNIKPDMSIEDQDALVDKLAGIKAVETDTDISEHTKGQRWYVESLVEFSGLNVEEQLEFCYNRKFAEQATEMEMLDALKEFAAA